MAFFFNETGASGDWERLLRHFEKLPYSYFEELSTHEKRVDVLRQYWYGALNLLRADWAKVIKVAEALKRARELSGDQIESILA